MCKSDHHIQETDISVRTALQNCALDIYQGRQGQNSQNVFRMMLVFWGLHQALTVWYQVAQSICPGFFLASKWKHLIPLTPVPPDSGSRISTCVMVRTTWLYCPLPAAVKHRRYPWTYPNTSFMCFIALFPITLPSSSPPFLHSSTVPDNHQ